VSLALPDPQQEADRLHATICAAQDEGDARRARIEELENNGGDVGEVDQARWSAEDWERDHEHDSALALLHHIRDTGVLPTAWQPTATTARAFIPTARLVPDCDTDRHHGPAAHVLTESPDYIDAKLELLCEACAHERETSRADNGPLFTVEPLLTKRHDLATLPARQIRPGMRTWHQPGNPLWDRHGWRFGVVKVEVVPETTSAQARTVWHYAGGAQQSFGYDELVTGYFKPRDIPAHQ
jgi:hypothetical protein